VSALYRIAGLDPETETTPKLRAVLTEHARLFLQTGGSLSLQEWSDLSDVERAAFVAAGKALDVEQAIRIGQASRGDLAALRVQAEIDGGRAHDDALLSTAVCATAKALGGSRGT
jgi:hypothetical protein